ncbi:hypothetical protein SAMN00790413_05070 [Deinococcus hopiensis KR-140]|uniref:Uncharacterized protein n=1 Tax=Deinococcus hopiensis KR-140 TaxID=695939 RepID=A0A1W1UTG7_9DEIO|nr:hypothetical protein SAMN00790413_05070 [Deinococcus hopiensis KR-140]
MGTPALAGTHTFIIPGFHAHTRKIYALIWASCPRREDTYRLPGGAFGFSRATFVVAALVREVDEATWRWGRVLGQLPAPYLMEWLRAARRALRCQGIAV